MPYCGCCGDTFPNYIDLYRVPIPFKEGPIVICTRFVNYYSVLCWFCYSEDEDTDYEWTLEEKISN